MVGHGHPVVNVEVPVHRETIFVVGPTAVVAVSTNVNKNYLMVTNHISFRGQKSSSKYVFFVNKIRS